MEMESKGKILLVEDDYNLGIITRKRLIEAGYEVDHVVDGILAYTHFMKTTYDLILLDIVLPKKNGYEVAKLIRGKNELIPIVFLSSKAADEDRIRGFKFGGDDYLTKPFSMQELLLRIDVWLKRSRTIGNDKTVTFKIGKLVFDYTEMRIINTVNKSVAIVTQREADLLKFLLINANKTIKREEILYHVWGKDDYFLGRSMDVFMTKIRKRFESETNVELVTLHGIGYKLVIEGKR